MALLGDLAKNKSRLTIDQLRRAALGATPILPGRNVNLTRVDGIGTTLSVPASFTPLTLYRVRLTQTGGSPGNATSVCSFTYSAFYWDDTGKTTAFATAVALIGRGNRIVAATMAAANYGYGFYDTDGTFKLIWCDEVFQQTNCAASLVEGGPELFGTGTVQEGGGATGTVYGDAKVTFTATNTVTKQISTANTSRTGSGTEGTEIVELLQAGASGGSLFEVSTTAIGRTRAGANRIFHQPGGTGTKYYIGQIAVIATEPQALESTFSASWFPRDRENGFTLKASDKIWVTTHNADTFNVTGFAANI